jgi:hypothetical protein
MPDLDRSALDRPARRRVDDREPQRQRDAGSSLGDVAAKLRVVDVVRALGLLRGEDAPDRARRLTRVASELPAACSERGRGEAEEFDERGAAGEETFDGARVALGDVNALRN